MQLRFLFLWVRTPFWPPTYIFADAKVSLEHLLCENGDGEALAKQEINHLSTNDTLVPDHVRLRLLSSTSSVGGLISRSTISQKTSSTSLS